MVQGFTAIPAASWPSGDVDARREALVGAVDAGGGEVVLAGGREIAISNPDKVLFPEAGHTKRDLVRYYLAVADGALRGAGGRPNVLVRYPHGMAGDFFYQKRAPRVRPPWVEVVALRFPSGRTAEEIVPRDAAALAWMANLACLELHPHPVRAEDLDHPDELRIDLDPVRGVPWAQVRAVAGLVRAVLEDVGLVGWPKTSGSRGMHVIVRIERRWTFDQVRRAALALAREVERRAPDLATSRWWKEERRGVFLDYNQNAKDRTVASAYSVRPTPDARVSAPLAWEEIDDCDPRDFTLATMPARVAAAGDRHEAIDHRVCSLDRLLELSARQEREGLGDAPWPPHYRKQPGEPPRVAPSLARAGGAAAKGRRTPGVPLIEIARARENDAALAGLERWRLRHPEAAAHLQPSDVLVDSMRGRFRTWTRIRLNLRHVPEPLRPAQEALDPDDEPDDWRGGPRRARGPAPRSPRT
jgi:DNA ligase D-like protein (predicted polymerase)